MLCYVILCYYINMLCYYVMLICYVNMLCYYVMLLCYYVIMLVKLDIVKYCKYIVNSFHLYKIKKKNKKKK